jgi:hypothetical protein
MLPAIPCIMHMHLYLQDEEHQFSHAPIGDPRYMIDYVKEPLASDVMDNPTPKQILRPSPVPSSFNGVACAHDLWSGLLSSVQQKHGTPMAFFGWAFD